MAPSDSNASRSPVPFPSTLWSEVLAVRDPASPRYRERMERLIGRYWRPVYWSLRLRWKQEADRAKDLAQDFFMEILEGRVVSTVDPQRGSFRAYLRRSLEFFMLDAMKSSYSRKQGGGRSQLPIDFGDGDVPAELADGSGDPDALFDRAWAHQLLDEGVEELLARLGAEGKTREAEIFRALDLGDAAGRPTVREMAERLGVSKSEVWKRLAEARRRLRSILFDKVKEYAADETDLFRELDDLFSG